MVPRVRCGCDVIHFWLDSLCDTSKTHRYGWGPSVGYCSGQPIVEHMKDVLFNRIIYRITLQFQQFEHRTGNLVLTLFAVMYLLDSLSKYHLYSMLTHALHWCRMSVEASQINSNCDCLFNSLFSLLWQCNGDWQISLMNVQWMQEAFPCHDVILYHILHTIMWVCYGMLTAGIVNICNLWEDLQDAQVYIVWCHFNMVNFLTNNHKRHPIACPLGQAMGCLLWIQHLIDILF